MRLLIAAFTMIMLLVTPAKARDWWEAETAHFIIKSRDKEEDVRKFAERVERFDRGMRFLNGMPEDHVQESRANKPTIYRFGTNSDMGRLIDSPGVAGFFISRAGDAVGFAPVSNPRNNSIKNRRLTETLYGRPTDDADETLYHEYTHYFMFQNSPATYPRWYSEGYAELMSTMRFFDDGRFHIGDVPQGRRYQIKRMSQSRLNEMLDADHKVNFRDYIQHYGTGWLLTHYLSFDANRELKLREFLVALGNGEDSLTAAERIFGDLDELQRELHRYKNGDFPGYTVRPNLLETPEVAMRKLTDKEVALIDEEMDLAILPTKEDGVKLARQISEVIAEHGDTASAFSLLAKAHFIAENYAAAEEAGLRAVTLDADNINGWLYRAYAAIEMGESDAAYYEIARDHLQQARAIDLDDPRPLIAYYDSFYKQSPEEGIPEIALVALEQAYDTAGSDQDYRLMLGRQLIMEDRFNEAQIVMRPALFLGHSFYGQDDDEDAFTPGRLFAAVNEGDKERAIELINKRLYPDEESARLGGHDHDH